MRIFNKRFGKKITMNISSINLSVCIKAVPKIFNPKKVCLYFGRHAFLFLLCIIFVEVILGALLYYKYAFLPENQTPQINSSTLRFSESDYYGILEEWQKRDERLQEPADENYENPF